MFIGIPIHHVPDVVSQSGLEVDGWIPVDQKNLRTRFPGVYAVGDVATGDRTVAKAGVFAEDAARVVAADIAAAIRGTAPPAPYEGAGTDGSRQTSSAGPPQLPASRRRPERSLPRRRNPVTLADGAGSGSDVRTSRRHLPREWQVLLLSSLAVFMVFLDVTIVNVAFPAIRRTFSDTSLSDPSWVLNAYNVIMAALVVPAGRIADRVGRRRVFWVGLSLFLLGSVAAGAAGSVATLFAARAVQAVGGAALIPASLGLVLAAFPAEKRAMATSVWAAAGAVAAATGPSLGVTANPASISE